MNKILEVAQGELGVFEKPGPGNNARIVEYHASTSIGASDDAVPWCSSFLNWCVEQAGYAGTDSPAARSWLQWGKAIDTPVKGCIVVLERGMASWQGHCGLYMGEDGDSIEVLGGNQGDAVNIRKYPKSKVLGFRVPKKATDSTTIKASTIGTVVAAVGGAVQSFPDEVVDKAGLISNVFRGFGEHWQTAVAVFLVIAAFGYIVRERLKKIDQRQI